MVPAKNHQLKYLEDLPINAHAALKEFDMDIPPSTGKGKTDGETADSTAAFKSKQPEQQQQQSHPQIQQQAQQQQSQQQQQRDIDFHEGPKSDSFIPNRVASKSFQVGPMDFYSIDE